MVDSHYRKWQIQESGGLILKTICQVLNFRGVKKFFYYDEEELLSWFSYQINNWMQKLHVFKPYCFLSLLMERHWVRNFWIKSIPAKNHIIICHLTSSKQSSSLWTYLCYHCCRFLKQFWKSFSWVSFWGLMKTNVVNAAKSHPAERQTHTNTTVFYRLPCSLNLHCEASGSSPKLKW